MPAAMCVLGPVLSCDCYAYALLCIGITMEAVDRARWKTCFLRGNGHVVKTDKEMMMNYFDSSKAMVDFHEIFQCGKGFHR